MPEKRYNLDRIKIMENLHKSIERLSPKKAKMFKKKLNKEVPLLGGFNELV